MDDKRIRFFPARGGEGGREDKVLAGVKISPEKEEEEVVEACRVEEEEEEQEEQEVPKTTIHAIQAKHANNVTCMQPGLLRYMRTCMHRHIYNPIRALLIETQ